MIKVIIIEDEKYAAEALAATLKDAVPDAEITAMLNSVEESIRFLTNEVRADLILCDVQLGDGLSFSIFSEVQVDAPIIFVTGYDKFMLNAFEYNGIDYLLKPVSQQELQRAFQKYRKLQKHFEGNHATGTNLLPGFNKKKKSRLIVHKGLEHIAILLDDIVLFYTENRIVYVLDKNGKKYLAEKNLADLETELDKDRFFRINRQYIVNIGYIRSFRSFERVKLQVELTMKEWEHALVVSQETAPYFKKWMAEENYGGV